MAKVMFRRRKSAAGCHIVPCLAFLFSILRLSLASVCPGSIQYSTSGGDTIAQLTRQPIHVGARADEASVFAATVVSLALSEILAQNATLQLVSEPEREARLGAGTDLHVIPGDVNAAVGQSGLAVGDILAANGMTPSLNLALNYMGSLGPLHTIGMYAPSYTVDLLNSMAQLLGLPGTYQPSGITGMPDDDAASALLALRHVNISSVVNHTVWTLPVHSSLAAKVLCAGGDFLASMGSAATSNLSDVRGFNSSLFSTAAQSNSGVVARQDSILSAMSLNNSLLCVSHANVSALEERVVGAVQAGQHFIVLGWSSWPVIATHSLRRLPLPAYDPQVFYTERLSDFSPWATISKMAWKDFTMTAHPASVALVQGLRMETSELHTYLQAIRKRAFVSALNSTSTVSFPLPSVNMAARSDFVGVNSSFSAFTGRADFTPYVQAACAWVAAHRGDIVRWGARLDVLFLTPPAGPPTGYQTLRIIGRGFGRVAPLSLTILVGESTCLSSAWVDDTVLQCVTPPGYAAALDVRVVMGRKSARLAGAYTYAPPVIRAALSVDASRSQYAGVDVVIQGSNFYPAPTLQCRFSGGTHGTGDTAATFINFTTIRCQPPSSFDGTLSLAVTNDGVRWSGGLRLRSGLLQFPSGSTDAPLDFGPSLAPPHLTLAFLNSDSSTPDLMRYYATVANETVAAAQARGLLPYTNITVVALTTTTPAESAPDQADSGAAIQAAQFASEQVALYARLRRSAPDLVGIVGARESVVSLPIAGAIMNKSLGFDPVVMVSYASTHPNLTASSTYPFFLRVVASDVVQGAALATLLLHLQPTLMRTGAIPVNATAPNVYAVVASDSDVSMAAFAAFADVLTAAGGNVERTASILTRHTVASITSRMLAAGILTDAPSTRVLLVLAPAATIARVIQAGQNNGLTGSTSPNARVWFGVDTFYEAINTYPATLGTTAGFAINPSQGRSRATSNSSTSAATSYYNTSTAAFIADAFIALLEPLDALIRSTKSREVSDYTAAKLAAKVRSTAFPNAATQFDRFSGTDNDPAVSHFDVTNTLALAASGLSPFITAAEVASWVGTLSGSVVRLDDSVALVVATGAQAAYRSPQTVTILVPMPLPPTINAAGLPALLDSVNYTQTYAYVQVTTSSGMRNFTLDLPQVYRGAPVVNASEDTSLYGTLPDASNVTFPTVLALTDPDDVLRPVGEQTSLFHPSSGWLAALEEYVEGVNSDTTLPLAGANVSLVLVPYTLVTGNGVVNAHANLQGALHDALHGLHVNNTPNVIGVLGLHTSRGTMAVIDAVHAYQDATLSQLPVISYGATLTTLSSPAAFPHFLRTISPVYTEATALVDLCRKYRWAAVGVIYSGVDDVLFDDSPGNGPSLYEAFYQEASNHNITILAAVNVSNYLSSSNVSQAPYHSATDTSASPKSFAAGREAGLFLDLLAMKQAGARVILVLTTKRTFCPIIRAAWAATMFADAPFMPLDAVSTTDFSSGVTRISNLRDNAAIPSSTTAGLDYTSPNTTSADIIDNLMSNASWALGADGWYYPRLSVTDTYMWVFSSETITRTPHLPCPAQLPPDPWATFYATENGVLQGYGRPPILEPDGNLRRALYDGYDKLKGLTIDSSLLYGSLGIVPSAGTLNDVAAAAARISYRNTQPTGAATQWWLSAPGTTTTTVSTVLVSNMSAWRVSAAPAARTLAAMLTPGQGTGLSIDAYSGASATTTAATQAAVLASASQYAYDGAVFHARNGLRMLLSAAAGAIADHQDVSDPRIMMTYLRGRMPSAGPVTALSITGGAPVPSIATGTNDPAAPQFDIVNRQGALANAVVRVGTLLERGYVRFTGCPAGSEPAGEFACRPCPVNSYKRVAGSQACSSCPLAGASTSRMITNGNTGAVTLSACLCPIGFYVADTTATAANDAGATCVPCTSAMLCNSVHLSLRRVKNSAGYWRGDATSPTFTKCMSAARCNVSDFTLTRTLTRSHEAVSMNGTSCALGSEGALCGVCSQGYGEDPRSGECDTCPTTTSIISSVLFASVMAVFLVSLLAVVQVSISPSYVAWRRINNTKLLLNFLHTNAILLTLNLKWPPVVKQYFNISQLSSSVNLSWISWECVLNSDKWPVSFQVFVLYMAAPLVLAVMATGLILLVREAVMRLCTFTLTSVDRQRGRQQKARSRVRDGACCACCRKEKEQGSGDGGSTATGLRAPSSVNTRTARSKLSTGSASVTEPSLLNGSNTGRSDDRLSQTGSSALSDKHSRGSGNSHQPILPPTIASGSGATSAPGGAQGVAGGGGALVRETLAAANATADANTADPRFRVLARRHSRLNVNPLLQTKKASAGVVKPPPALTRSTGSGRNLIIGPSQPSATTTGGGERPTVTAGMTSNRGLPTGRSASPSSGSSFNLKALPVGGAANSKGLLRRRNLREKGSLARGRTGTDSSGGAPSGSDSEGEFGSFHRSSDPGSDTGDESAAGTAAGDDTEIPQGEGSNWSFRSKAGASTIRKCTQACSFSSDIFCAVSTIGLFLLYPTLLRVILDMLTCTDVGSTSFLSTSAAAATEGYTMSSSSATNGTVSSLVPVLRSYLRYDMTVRCDGGLYTTFQPLAYLFAFVYIAGIPLAFFAIMSSRQLGLHLGRGRVRIGGTSYKLVAQRLRKIASWYRNRNLEKLRYFGGQHGVISARLRAVFDRLYCPPTDGLTSSPNGSVLGGDGASGYMNDAASMRSGATPRADVPSTARSGGTGRYNGSDTPRSVGSLSSPPPTPNHNNNNNFASGAPSRTSLPSSRSVNAMLLAGQPHHSARKRGTVSDGAHAGAGGLSMYAIRDLSFDICPTTTEDFLSPSLAIQQNLSFARLLEATYEEATAIAYENVGLLSISGDSDEEQFSWSQPRTWCTAALSGLGITACMSGIVCCRLRACCGSRRSVSTPVDELASVVFPRGVPRGEAWPPQSASMRHTAAIMMMTARGANNGEGDQGGRASFSSAGVLPSPAGEAAVGMTANPLTQVGSPTPTLPPLRLRPAASVTTTDGASAHMGGDNNSVGGEGGGFDVPPGTQAPSTVSIEELRRVEFERGRLDTDLLLSYSLLKAAEKLEHVGRMQRRFGWLFVDYRPSAFTYEFWNTSKKAALVGAAVVLASKPGMLQCTVCILLLLLYMLNHQRLRPFLDIALTGKGVDPLASSETILGDGNEGDESRELSVDGPSGRAVHNSGIFSCGTRRDDVSPVTLGYLGPQQRHLMRLRAILALTHLDEADMLRVSSFAPEAAVAPTIPTLAAYRTSQQVVRFARSTKGGADDSANEVSSGTAALAALSVEDVMLMNPSLLRPWQLYCCTDRARRLSRSQSRCACACPWWGHTISMIPEVVTASWLDRIAMVVQLLCLILLFIYEAQNASTDAGTVPATTLLSWVMLLNVAFTWLLVAVIAVDLFKEFQFLGVKLMTARCCCTRRSKLNVQVELSAAHTLNRRRTIMVQQVGRATMALSDVPQVMTEDMKRVLRV